MMADSKLHGRQAKRAQRIWTFLAAGAVAATTAVVTMAPPDSGAEAASAPAAAPAAAQPAVAPAVLQNSFLVEGEERKDRRNLQAGLTIEDGYIYFWGWGKCGALGYKTTCGAFATPDNAAPTLVGGLPQGAIVEATGGIYNYNAVDTAGHVWGWGSYSNRDGTGSRSGTGASYPPKRIRIGASWDDRCWQKVGSSNKIVSNCGKPLLGDGDPVKILSGTEMSGAAITQSGLVYSWGGMNYGGVGIGDIAGSLTNGDNVWGAVKVQGLPDPTIPGNKPIQLEGGYQTYWILLENGDVYYFGGNPSSVLGSPFERAIGDHEREYSGRPTITSYTSGYPQGQGQIAVKSVALAPWFRSADNPNGYVVMVHSGIAFGAALLSTGRVLTWGRNDGLLDGHGSDWGALGRYCPDGTTGTSSQKTAVRDNCYRSPGYVEFNVVPTPKIVSLACSFTAVTVLAEDGTLYGWGTPLRSYEGYPTNIEGGGRGKEVFEFASEYIARQSSGTYRDYGAVIVVDRYVTKFQVGQGFVIWWDRNGKMWGRGWQENGALGHHGGNWGRPGFFNETRKRWVWFSAPEYEGCDYGDQVSPGYGGWTDGENITFRTDRYNSYTYVNSSGAKVTARFYCSDLNEKVNGAWTKRFTFEECVQGKCKGVAGNNLPLYCDADTPLDEQPEDCACELLPEDQQPAICSEDGGPPKPGDFCDDWPAGQAPPDCKVRE
ncbi:MAG: hypothetical protein LBG60_15230 [Bifidobacteriaceae bacterium]|jgi:alpha-tubulin suppressor-like RCC1 family protein|nr:hypothetical protein [Bifidobacteriaceae bacterium]